MKTVAAFCVLASASAFAPASQSQKSLALSALIDDAFGISIETGNKCPPLGREILKDAGPGGVKWFQNAEIKHGRVASHGCHYWILDPKDGRSLPSLLGTLWIQLL